MKIVPIIKQLRAIRTKSLICLGLIVNYERNCLAVKASNPLIAHCPAPTSAVITQIQLPFTFGRNNCYFINDFGDTFDLHCKINLFEILRMNNTT